MSDILRSTHVGELKICGVTLRCHHLSDGRRVIEEQGLVALFSALEAGATLGQDESDALARFARA